MKIHLIIDGIMVRGFPVPDVALFARTLEHSLGAELRRQFETADTALPDSRRAGREVISLPAPVRVEGGLFGATLASHIAAQVVQPAPPPRGGPPHV